MIALIHQEFAKKLAHLVDDPASCLIIQPIHWAKVFEEREDELLKKTVLDSHLDYQCPRKFMIHYLGVAIAYQPVETAKHNYERVHEGIGTNLNILAKKTGSDAPLCVISHNLGSVIPSNYSRTTGIYME